MMRQPIIVTMGHVDHGKTSLLDKIRGTAVASKEAGAITQHILASEISRDAILNICKSSLEKMGVTLTIPGLLFVDTPGHEAFTNLRERGGSIADIAILVVDIMQGFQPQTIESIKILRQYKTPFILAANKIDLIEGWIPQKTNSFLESFGKQNPSVQARLDEILYSIIGRLSEFGFESERFDRVSDFSKQIGIVPVSAKTGEGISEILLFLSGLSQKFLESQLKTEVSGPGKGSILEVKEEKGLGTTIDVILYEGAIRTNDEIIFGTSAGVSETKVRALLKPKLPGERGEAGEKYSYVEEAHAAAGIKIYAPGLENALPGSPFVVAGKNREEQKNEIGAQLKKIIFETGGAGIIIKADTLGSVEALTKLLSSEGIKIRSAKIGNVTKKDVMDACAVRSEEKYLGVILAFGVGVNEDALSESEKSGIKIFRSNVIYTLSEEYEKWVSEEKEREKKRISEEVIFPAKIKVLPFCFRAAKPAIFGIEILAGKLRAKTPLINEKGEEIGEVRNIQSEKKEVEEAVKGTQVAISIDGPVFGRSLKEGDILFSSMSKEDADLLLSKQKEYLSEEEVSLIKEILKLKGLLIF